MIRQNLILLVVLVAGLLEQTKALPIQEARIDTCLNKIELDIASLQVPNKVEKVAAFVRSLNPNLGNHLTSLIVDKRANLDIISAGFITSGSYVHDSYVDACTEYVEKAMEIFNNTECGDSLVELINPHLSQYEVIMKGHTAIDEAMGYVQGCMLV